MRTYCIAPTVYCIGTLRVSCGDLKGKEIQMGVAEGADGCKYTANSLLSGDASGKESALQCRRFKRGGLDPWLEKIPRRRKWQPTPVFLPRKFHRKGSLMGYSLWGHRDLDTTEHTCHS